MYGLDVKTSFGVWRLSFIAGSEVILFLPWSSVRLSVCHKIVSAL